MKLKLLDRLFLLAGAVVLLVFYLHFQSLSTIEDGGGGSGSGSGGLRSKISNVLYKELSEDLEAMRRFRLETFEEALLNRTYERFAHSLDHKRQQRREPEPEPESESKPESEHSTQKNTPTTATATPVDLTCTHGSLVQYWRAPTAADLAWTTPFAGAGAGAGAGGADAKYVTFEPDVGGWNNIRMQMETVLVFAFATGRTLVLPPDQPMYLLNKGKGHHNEHSFADFFPFDSIQTRMRVITMDEFLRREAVPGRLVYSDTGLPYYPPRESFRGTVASERNEMWAYLRNATSCPPWKCMREYLVVPRRPGFNSTREPDAAEYERRRLEFAGDPKFGMRRESRLYDERWQAQKVIHFISKTGSGFRLLQHFYTFLHFEDDGMDRLLKRFVRDHVHYVPLIHCRAALIVARLLELGNGSYSAWHVRRGEFQYKETRLPAEELLKNVGHFIPAGEVLFVATDERDKDFFAPFRQRFPRIYFLDDFAALAGLAELNPNYLGMVDQVVCTRGRLFMGTWFSTFTGYITRMRGYLGLQDTTVRYTDLKHRDRFQHDEAPRFPFYMREFPLAWRGIDLP